jgi:hypothetical protein
MSFNFIIKSEEWPFTTIPLVLFCLSVFQLKLFKELYKNPWQYIKANDKADNATN